MEFLALIFILALFVSCAPRTQFEITAYSGGKIVATYTGNGLLRAKDGRYIWQTGDTIYEVSGDAVLVREVILKK